MNKALFISGWKMEAQHIERWVRAHINAESQYYDHTTHEANASVYVPNGKSLLFGSGRARCRHDDVPDARIGRELARDRAVQDVVVQVLVARIARDVCRKQRNADSIIALIAQAVRESLEQRAKCAREVVTLDELTREHRGDATVDAIESAGVTT